MVSGWSGENGKARLFDGRSGEPLPDPIAVGYIYILKLNHLVDDKIHARSTGPYSMITQQPLGGRRSSVASGSVRWSARPCRPTARRTRFRELLTIKSDDVLGRVKVYEAIVKAEHPRAGIPVVQGASKELAVAVPER